MLICQFCSKTSIQLAPIEIIHPPLNVEQTHSDFVILVYLIKLLQTKPLVLPINFLTLLCPIQAVRIITIHTYPI